MQSVSESFREQIQKEIRNAWYCEHRMDNGFLSPSWSETAAEMEKRGYQLRGVCLEPEYRPQMGYGLMFFDKNGDGAWVHVPESFMTQWLMDLGLTPPDDVIWDRAAFRDYVWRRKGENDRETAK